ncbi:hypothetical protein HDV06_006357 [Boothiomyces sp. JEL0866]|nr:hypothetical protein HDV06_006357 [Boothiomyces sp. JEL0866]
MTGVMAIYFVATAFLFVLELYNLFKKPFKWVMGYLVLILFSAMMFYIFQAIHIYISDVPVFFHWFFLWLGTILTLMAVCGQLEMAKLFSMLIPRLNEEIMTRFQIVSVLAYPVLYSCFYGLLINLGKEQPIWASWGYSIGSSLSELASISLDNYISVTIIRNLVANVNNLKGATDLKTSTNSEIAQARGIETSINIERHSHGKSKNKSVTTDGVNSTNAKKERRLVQKLQLISDQSKFIYLFSFTIFLDWVGIIIWLLSWLVSDYLEIAKMFVVIIPHVSKITITRLQILCIISYPIVYFCFYALLVNLGNEQPEWVTLGYDIGSCIAGLGSIALDNFISVSIIRYLYYTMNELKQAKVSIQMTASLSGEIQEIKEKKSTKSKFMYMFIVTIILDWIGLVLWLGSWLIQDYILSIYVSAIGCTMIVGHIISIVITFRNYKLMSETKQVS